MYKSVSMFLFDVKPSNNMDHSSKSIVTEAAVKDKEYTRHLQSKGYIFYFIGYMNNRHQLHKLWAKSTGMKVVEPFINEH